MLLCGFIDFDDTIFASSLMTKFFNKKQGVFVPPKPVVDRISAIDRLVTDFILRHMSYCRFRIVTHASTDWIYQALRFMPTLNRFVTWNYVQVIPCENFTKFSKIYDIISREKSGDLYFCCGDSPHDVEAVPAVVKRLNIVCRTRSVLFVRNPSLESLQFQWERMPGIFNELIKAPEDHIGRHFVVTDDCKQYAKPGWYGHGETSTSHGHGEALTSNGHGETSSNSVLPPTHSPPRQAPSSPTGSIESLSNSAERSRFLPLPTIHEQPNL